MLAVNKLDFEDSQSSHARGGTKQYCAYLNSEEGRSRRALRNDAADRMRSIRGTFISISIFWVLKFA